MRLPASVAFVLLLACLPARALTLLTEENPPLNFTREGKLAGVSVEVVREMARRAELAADIRVAPWSEAFRRAQAEPEVCVFSTARLPARNAMFQWVGPISRGYWSAFALDGFADYVPKVDDLKKYRVGVVSDARARYLRQRGFTKLVESERDSDLPARLTLDPGKDNAIDLWVTQGLMAPEIARKAGVGPVKEVFAGIMSQEYWLACNLQMPKDTIRSLGEALGSMKKDGSYRRLSDVRSVAPPN
ncbi:MAG: transporter substrate-binding domain-containing protein [Proteobacteria bacterium]|nr:transporter substrate-binding domain-containing protein [Pseudomonadota bacterium]